MSFPPELGARAAFLRHRHRSPNAVAGRRLPLLCECARLAATCRGVSLRPSGVLRGPRARPRGFDCLGFGRRPRARRPRLGRVRRLRVDLRGLPRRGRGSRPRMFPCRGRCFRQGAPSPRRRRRDARPSAPAPAASRRRSVTLLTVHVSHGRVVGKMQSSVGSSSHCGVFDNGQILFLRRPLDEPALPKQAPPPRLREMAAAAERRGARGAD